MFIKKVAALAMAAVLVFTPTAVAEELTLSFGPKDLKEKPLWREYAEYYNSFTSEVWAHSPTMDRDIPLFVIHGGNRAEPRPTIYLLNGADGGQGRANWIMQTDVIDYYRHKDVNVVIPMEGEFSYYTDWPGNKKQQWETFLTKELPPVLEPAINGNGERGIAGMSMSATSSLLLAEHNPGFYKAVASYSGCASTRNTIWGFLASLITLLAGGHLPFQAFGSLFNGNALYNDALYNAGDLRGTKLYVSTGSGMPGTQDLLASDHVNYNLDRFFTLVINGAIIEGVTSSCTHDLEAKLNAENIPATFKYRNTGTHTWTYWEKDLRDSWPTFAEAFGLPVLPSDLEYRVRPPAKRDRFGDFSAFLSEDLSADLSSDGKSNNGNKGNKNTQKPAKPAPIGAVPPPEQQPKQGATPAKETSTSTTPTSPAAEPTTATPPAAV